MTSKTRQTVLEALEFSKQIMLRHLDSSTEKDDEIIKELLKEINEAKDEIQNIRGVTKMKLNKNTKKAKSMVNAYWNAKYNTIEQLYINPSQLKRKAERETAYNTYLIEL